MTRSLSEFFGGLELPTYKELSKDEESILTPLPKQVILPLQQHIGIPARPIVSIGEHVLKGQIIAESNGYISIPIHSSTSGTVLDIGYYHVPHPFAIKEECIVIEPDGKDEMFAIQPVQDYEALGPEALQNIIRQCGIAGLGGAGFPAHVKLQEGVDNAVDTLIINGVECEPYITCDDRLIREKAIYVVAGARMIRHAVQAKHCVIAVEDDMPEAHEALAAEILDYDDIELVKVPSRYPAGGEKQLIQVLTGKQVPSGGLAIHIGIVIHNVATAAAVYRAVTRGEPMISRYVTVSGKVKEPRNLQVLLGTPVSDCLKLCGYEGNESTRIILGGPMMGIHVKDDQLPITKTTNCILVLDKETPNQAFPCIRCDQCSAVCPVNLMPQELYRFTKADQFDRARDYHLFDCIECGCCSYSCPSNIPLVQYYRYAKQEIAVEERKKLGADKSRQRFIQRKARLEKQENEKTKKRKIKKELANQSKSKADKQKFIQEAIARSKARRSTNTGKDD